MTVLQARQTMLQKACGGVGGSPYRTPPDRPSAKLCLNTMCPPDERVRSERAARSLRRDPNAWGAGGSAAALRPHPALDLRIEFSSQTDDWCCCTVKIAGEWAKTDIFL